jgi:NAD-dependent dihydropyrimidine dehydrogenase PreA subunit
MQIHLQTASKSGLQTSLLKALCVASTPVSVTVIRSVSATGDRKAVHMEQSECHGCLPKVSASVSHHALWWM